jgi:galactokinase
MWAEATAPGRIDFLGGVADYSGSWVLEAPIHRETKVAIKSAEHWTFQSEQADDYALPDGLWLEASALAELDAIRGALEEAGVPTWVKYVLGCTLVLAHDRKLSLPVPPLAFAVDSAVPLGMGVSSSAAIEIATLRALTQLFDLTWKRTELARAAQRAENEIVGAPCGLMDQLTSAYGRPRSLLPILCRPDELDDPIPLPEGVVIAGWPSGVKHSVGASPYATARAGAFMGKKILETELRRQVAHLTEIKMSELTRVADKLPLQMAGREFVLKHRSHDDPLTAFPDLPDDAGPFASAPDVIGAPKMAALDSTELAALSSVEVEQLDRKYPVRAAVQFPIEESHRARLAKNLLRAIPKERDRGRCEQLRLIGELLFQSHEGYSAIGLGSTETDEMVGALREIDPDEGIYGARVSAGGSGGTVVVLLEASALTRLEQLRRIFNTPHPLILV